MGALLDHRLDELAAKAHPSVLPRLLITIAASALSLCVLAPAVCLFWVGVLAALEIQAWFATRRQYLGQPVGWTIRLWHITGFGASVAGWISVGGLMWTSGSVEGALFATILWVSVIFFTQNNGFQSPLALVVGGVAPATAVILVVLLVPHAPNIQPLPIIGMLAFALTFAGDLVRQNLAARRLLDHANARLRESEESYRLLAEQSPDVIVRTDLAGTLQYVSPAIRRYGYEPLDLIGRTAAVLMKADEKVRFTEYFVHLNAGRARAKGSQGVVHMQDAKGATVDFMVLTSPFLDAEGRIIGAIGVLRDMTLRLALEAELRTKRAEAEAAAAAKSEFLANMSHEIRTPLTAILGFTELLAGAPELGAAAKAHVGRISAAGKALLAIVNDILDFSKLEAGEMVLKPRPSSPAELVTETLALFEAQAGAKGLTLDARCDAALPGRLLIDPDRLRQVLVNLVGNALKFTDEGGVTVACAYDAEAERLQVEVRDTGAGMTGEQQAKLFQRFSQVDGSTTRKHGGTGLGLAISRAFIDAMGGEIGVESVVGEGSVFHFWAPAPLAEADEAASEGAGEAGLAGVRVLVVDDNPANRQLARAFIETLGAEVTTAEDGLGALEQTAGAAFDIILMDVRMPGLDGPAAAARIRAEPGPNQDTPILAFTADVQSELGGGRDGFDGIVHKPIVAAELAAAILGGLTRRRERPEAA